MKQPSKPTFISCCLLIVPLLFTSWTSGTVGAISTTPPTIKNVLSTNSVKIMPPLKVTPQEVEDERDFDYVEGSKKGPTQWGDIKKEWAACKNGGMQSPIDLSSQRVQVSPSLAELKITHKPSKATLKNRGHDIRKILRLDARRTF
ncbi:hypothetical protein M0R45_029543 [Rubus argutus]|uniref:Alpha-carbonic anhydrase domain-containing protein n=1 Tax=Rubus argutus TaxID=59490 RepID=A0AAW1WAU4_RUBAR